MLRKASDLINLPVINLTSGSQVAKVKDLVLNADDDSLLGFICDNNTYLPLKAIKTLGKDAVVVEVDNIDGILEPFKTPINAPLFLPEYLIGTPIITENGKNIGTVGDILIAEDTCKIEGYEISDGLLKDLVAGRSIISIPQVITYGEDAVVIKEQ
ncbi:MAG: hypothetical protein PWQ67_1632 [Clostridia bacterium]|jgi:uncharacterized protein YrrD|nr:hypothetical protein [Clostridia bacterium]MDN5323178.1 hypothetical protein [Clostridia bacterium]